MAAPQNIIAVIFDFDDTLTDDSTSQLLEEFGVDVDKFWKVTMQQRVAAGWDPALAYLNYIAENSGNRKPFGKLSNAALRDFGAGLKFYPGLFEELRNITKEHSLSNPGIEFYIISGGLEEIISGSKIARHVNGIRGCRYDEGPDGVIRSVKNVISFTEKTRYIYEINKGLLGESRDQPYDVNEQMAPENRRVPFQNMLYIGDGLTDVPCFSLITHFGGKAFGVFDPGKAGSPRKAWEKLVAPHRVMSMNSPKYRKTDDLGMLLRVAVNSICSELDLRTRTALRR